MDGTAVAVVNAVLGVPPRLGGARLLAIDGPSGAGKSTLAASVVADLRARGISAVLISTDDFATWGDPVSWWPRLVDGVLERLREGRPGRYCPMDWTSGSPRPGRPVTVDVPEVLVLEGVSSGRASVRPSLSYLCWLDGPEAATRLERAVARDGEASRHLLGLWQAFERGWFEVDRTRQYAVSNGQLLP
jgi:ABC-type dipeptide/oligopeptide/nickel transport system ATPase component